MTPTRAVGSLAILVALCLGLAYVYRFQPRPVSLSPQEVTFGSGVQAVAREDVPGLARGHARAPGLNRTATTAAVTGTTAATTTTAAAAVITVGSTTTAAANTTSTTGVAATTASTTITTAAATTTITTAAATTTTSGAGEVVIKAGEGIQSFVDRYPAGTVFRLQAGIYSGQQVTPRDRQQFLGDAGAVLQGAGRQTAFGGSATGVVIAGLVIEGYSSSAQMGAIHTGGTNWVLRGNEVRNNAAAGIVAGPGFQVLDNNVHHNGQIGIKAGGSNVLIEGNEIAFNNHRDAFDMNWEAGGTKFLETVGLVVRDNYVHDNHGPGLWTDYNNFGTVYEGNAVIGNYGPGIFHEISYDATVRNNRLEGNGFRMLGGAITISNSSNVEVYGNTLFGNNGGVWGIHHDRGSGNRGAFQTKNLWVHDNTVSYASGSTGVFATAGGADPYLNWGNRFDRNTYSALTDPRPFDWMGGEHTRAEWLAYGQDLSSAFN